MFIKYVNILQSRALQILPKLVFLVWKENIWQPRTKRRRVRIIWRAQLGLPALPRTCHNLFWTVRLWNRVKNRKKKNFNVSKTRASVWSVFESSHGVILTRWVWEKNIPKCSQTHFWSKINTFITFTIEKIAQKFGIGTSTYSLIKFTKKTIAQ
jgi:hypothetical protein